MSKAKVDKSKMCMLIDTREQVNQHIENYFNDNKINYRYQKLDFGDYSFEYDGNSFEYQISVERKRDIDELSGNLTSGKKREDGTRDGRRERFVREHKRASQAGAKLIWLIEDDSIANVYDWMYRSQLRPNSYIASILSFYFEYDLNIHFVPSRLSGMHIANTLYYFLRNYLKCSVAMPVLSAIDSCAG